MIRRSTSGAELRLDFAALHQARAAVGLLDDRAFGFAIGCPPSRLAMPVGPILRARVAQTLAVAEGDLWRPNDDPSSPCSTSRSDGIVASAAQGEEDLSSRTP